MRHAQAVEHASHTRAPTPDPGQRHGSGVVLYRDLVAALQPVQVGEAVLGGGLTDVATGGPCGGESGRGDGEPFDGAHAPPEIGAQRVGQQPRDLPC